MNPKHIVGIDALGLISLRPMVVHPAGSGRAHNDRFIISDSLFANFLIIIYETKNSMRGSLMGCACTKGKVSVYKIYVPIRFKIHFIKVSKDAWIRNRYNQVPHLTQDTNGKVTNSQLDTTNESQEVSPFPAGDHKAHINRRSQRHSKHKTQKKYRIGTVSKIFNWRA